VDLCDTVKSDDVAVSHFCYIGITQRHFSQVPLTTRFRHRFDSLFDYNSTALRPFNYLRYDCRATWVGCCTAA